MSLNLFGKKSSEDRFWHWFNQHADDYYYFDENQKELHDALSSQLAKVDSNLVFDFSPVHEDRVRELTISANGMKELFPQVISLIKSAPSIEGWKFIAFRQRAPHLSHVTYKGIFLDYKDVYFRFARDFGKIGLEVHMKGYDETNPDHDSLTYVLLDQVLGEYDTEMKLSRIEVISLDMSEVDTLFSLNELPEIVDNYIKEFYN